MPPVRDVKDAAPINEAQASTPSDSEVTIEKSLEDLRRIVSSKIMDMVKSREIARVQVDQITGARRIVVERTNNSQWLMLARYLDMFSLEKVNITNRQKIPPGGVDNLSSPGKRLAKTIEDIQRRAGKSTNSYR